VPDDAGMTAGFDPSRLARLPRFLRGEVDAGRLPGAVVAVARGDEVALHEAVGLRDPATGVPMTTDTLFWLASMTKPVTAAGALLLHEQGRLALEAEVGEYLPGFADRRVWDRTADAPPGGALPTRAALRQPTVLDLLRHTAGIPEGMFGDTPVHELSMAAVGNGMTAYTGAEYAERLSGVPLLHDPGTEWHYGWGVDLTGLILESLTGEPLGAYLTRAVLGPLGMADTTFGVPAGARERYAADRVPDPRTGAHLPLPDLSIARFDAGGAGLVGTAGDYLRFARMLLGRGGGLLARTSVDFMLADQLAPDVDVTDLQRPGWNPGYGFGVGLAVRRSVGAYGPGSPGEATWPGAAGTFWWADPREDLAVVVLAHHTFGARLEQRVRALIYQALI
jgi:CubicO group peptidase (beta-lactamase class C family)